MTLLAVCSAKASPGVTTTALALGAAWPDQSRVVVAECDPAGGDLAAWAGLPASRGLVSLAAAARHHPTVATLTEHCQRLHGGLEVLVGPAGAEHASGALRVLPDQLWAAAERDRGLLVVADCGRLWSGSAAAALAAGARLVLVVARPVAAELGHAAALLGTLERGAGAVGLVLIGEGAYRPAEIAEALGVEVAGVLPTDRHGAAALGGRVTWAGGLRRAALVRGARGLASRLCAGQLAVQPSQAAQHGPPGAAVWDASATLGRTREVRR